MAVLAALPTLEIISGFKGTLDYYVYMGLAVCRKWPRSPGHARAPAVQAQWQPFATAARLWGTLPAHVQDAYSKMASGSSMNGRDLSVKLYLNAKAIYYHIP